MSNSQKEIIRSFIDSLENESYLKDELYGALEHYIIKIERERLLGKKYDELQEYLGYQIMKDIDTSDVPPAGSM